MMEPHTKVCRHEVQGTSVNAIFAITGPTAGVLRIRSPRAPSHSQTIDDATMLVLNDCFDAVAVPADQYWRAASCHHALLHTTMSDISTRDNRTPPAASALAAAVTIKRPEPNDIPASFYATRVDAISQRQYEVNRGVLIIGADLRSGSSGKMFNKLSRHELSSFTGAIPFCHHRNLYTLVDENAAVDPFFDIDCHPPFDWIKCLEPERESETTLSSPPASFDQMMPAVVEQWLGQILLFLRDKVEAATGARLQQCVVLTSSVLVNGKGNISSGVGEGGNAEDGEEENADEEGKKSEICPLLSMCDSKLSFHIHFRLDTNTAFANVRELHRFMWHIREELDESISNPSDSDTVSLHRMLRRCIDFGVYTRWRPFRLPYNVKVPSPVNFCPADAAVLDLMILTLSQSTVNAASFPDLRVGVVAPSVVHLIDLSALQTLSSQQRLQQHRLLTKLFFLFRFLLPVVPGVTAITDKGLLDFLSSYSRYPSHDGLTEEEYRQQLAILVFDLAAIQRDSCIESLNEEKEVVKLRLVKMDASNGDPGDPTTAPSALQNPFLVPRPPHRDGVRMPVRDAQLRDLVAEVFRCLSIEYDTGGIDGGNNRGCVVPLVIGDRISVQYQDGIRAYYAQQKLSRFCLRLNREHRGTYSQLYLTYGSIKIRCYSNDCCGSCLAVKWSAGDDERVAGPAAVLLPVDGLGYPKYERLEMIRRLLFPPLPPEELLRRYGAVSLEGVHEKQKE
ncbi:hypothetical protein DQ04_13991010 [Trypanosoma grayi]|uniref:hypothetical protein n=1 Tax=Trypanosoma grayi TaxID=71804 RepID=UPI0004F458DB|nr:hypothetical protein DQ04_13991010 [Trypanosoma grayi]KEG06423.1 hypothetical protein DQ04_13991010 [Trypanosoma grayi]